MSSVAKYHAVRARCARDVERCQRLRAKCFAVPSGIDRDEHDDVCTHFMIMTDQHDLVACFRILRLSGGAQIEQSYAAQYYELSALEAYDGVMMEMGRFCIDPDVSDPDIVRVAWAALTEFVHEHNVSLLFGCASFSGTDQEPYLDAFSLLKHRHVGPKRWLPQVKAPNVFRFASRLVRPPDMRRAMRAMPPLLKSYLMMGGWVSDHAVIDAQMNTIHVFTGVEIDSIPPARKRLLTMAAARA